jgi:hypothetical protein
MRKFGCKKLNPIKKIPNSNLKLKPLYLIDKKAYYILSIF